MNILYSFPKSRLFILLFVLTFTSLPGAFSLNAKTTGNFKENNYVCPSTHSHWETRTNILTTSAWPAIVHHTQQTAHYTLHTTHYTQYTTHYTQHTNNLIPYDYDTNI